MGAQEGRIFELHPGPNRIFELPPGPNRIFELPPGPNRIIKLPPGPNRIIKLPPGSDSEKPFTMLLKQAVEKANEKRFLEQAPRQLHTLAEENDNLKAQVESLERSQEALQASSSSQQAVVSELTAEVQTLKDALEAAAQREASELKAQVTRFAEGMEAVHASLNSQTAAMVAQQAWLRALAPQAGGISGLQGSDLNSWNLVGQSQPGETGSMAGVSAAGISIESTGPRCFLTDAIFKTPSGLREAIHLHESAVVVAENGTELKVRSEPETHVAHVSLNLQTANARLQITPDHRIVLPDQSTAAWTSKLGTVPSSADLFCVLFPRHRML